MCCLHATTNISTLASQRELFVLLMWLEMSSCGTWISENNISPPLVLLFTSQAASSTACRGTDYAKRGFYHTQAYEWPLNVFYLVVCLGKCVWSLPQHEIKKAIPLHFISRCFLKCQTGRLLKERNLTHGRCLQCTISQPTSLKPALKKHNIIFMVEKHSTLFMVWNVPCFFYSP